MSESTFYPRIWMICSVCYLPVTNHRRHRQGVTEDAEILYSARHDHNTYLDDLARGAPRRWISSVP